MDEHPIAPFEGEDQVLPPPPHALDAAADVLGGAWRDGLQRGELEEVEPLELRTVDDASHPLGERLDLWHLGHAPLILSAAGPRRDG